MKKRFFNTIKGILAMTVIIFVVMPAFSYHHKIYQENNPYSPKGLDGGRVVVLVEDDGRRVDPNEKSIFTVVLQPIILLSLMISFVYFVYQFIGLLFMPCGRLIVYIFDRYLPVKTNPSDKSASDTSQR